MKIRVFVLADDYRWHVLTDNFDTFRAHLSAYADVMNTSKKENTYRVMNLFMSKEEYETNLRNLKKIATPITKNHLTLIDDN